jgi:hypothetical protein
VEALRVVRRRGSHIFRQSAHRCRWGQPYAPAFNPKDIPGTHFCYRLSRPQGHSAAGRIRSLEKSNRTLDLPAYSIVSQPTTLSRAPTHAANSYAYRGGAVPQAVIRWLPTAAAWVRVQIRSCRIGGGPSGIRAGFIRVLLFTLPILIPPTAQHSSSIIRDWYNRPVSGRRTKWTQSHPTPRN